MLKRVSVFALSLCLVAGMLPAAAYAQEDTEEPAPDEEYVLTAETTEEYDDEDFDADFALEGYLYSPLSYGIATLSTDHLDSFLSGNNKLVYEKVKAMVKDVAAGQRDDTTVTFDILNNELTIDKTSYTAAELEVASIIENGAITQAAKDAFGKKVNIGFNPNLVRDAVCNACPYELFWRSSSYSIGYSMSASSSDGVEYICLASVSFTFKVSDEYKGTDDSHVDPTRIAAVNGTYESAMKIVAANAGKSDYEKLKAYMVAICGLVDYDHEAAANTTRNGGPSWQLVNVFDGDPDTKVVCEGYSKAFQYLCDLTTFTGDVWCYPVSGNCGGAHMWNTVRMDDGKNYLVDVTNCDQSRGIYDALFMASAAMSNVSSPFTVGSNTYTYDATTIELYGTEYLMLSDTACKIPPDPKFYSASITLSDDLTINFKVDKAGFDAGYTNPYVVFEFNGATQTINNPTVTETQYIFSFTNIAPNMMNDAVTATLYGTTSDGVEYSSIPKRYCIADYCYSLLNSSSITEPVIRTLLVDLLNYGTAAQNYTGYCTSNLANAKLTADQQAWASTSVADYVTDLNLAKATITDPAVTWEGVSLVLTNNVQFRFRISAADVNDLSVRVSSGGTNWDVSDFNTAGDGQYYFRFRGLNPAQLRDSVDFTVYRGETPVSNTITYSVESYAASQKDSGNVPLVSLIDAMMKYGDSTKAYATAGWRIND